MLAGAHLLAASGRESRLRIATSFTLPSALRSDPPRGIGFIPRFGDMAPCAQGIIKTAARPCRLSPLEGQLSPPPRPLRQGGNSNARRKQGERNSDEGLQILEAGIRCVVRPSPSPHRMASRYLSIVGCLIRRRKRRCR